MQASVRRLVIMSLKAFLRLEKFYSSTVDLPARGAAAGLMASLGLSAPRRPAFSGSPVHVATPPQDPDPASSSASSCGLHSPKGAGMPPPHQHQQQQQQSPTQDVQALEA